MQLFAVIMAGGSGTRFWPMSRRNRPKHLLSLVGGVSLLQQTVNRIHPLIPPTRMLVITGRDHWTEVREQLGGLPQVAIVAEPCRRDTAPCIGLAATLVRNRERDGIMVVMPADHVIEPDEEFCATITAAAELVREDPKRLVTLGIRPLRAATGYGYIQRGYQLVGITRPAYQVKQFREKPGLKTAEEYLRTGEFYWNSGVFVWTAEAILEELRCRRTAMAEALDRIGRAWDTDQQAEVLDREFSDIESESIDYAVLEHSRNTVVIEAGFRWDDVGSWGALPRLKGANPDGNTVQGLHCGIDTTDCTIMGDPDHLVATVGVHNLIIVQSLNCTLVAHRDSEESVKRLVELVRQQGMEGFL